MILKRKDLAKEFELIVKQEIINHNNSMLATNVALEKMRKQIEDFVKQIKSEVEQLKKDLSEECKFRYEQCHILVDNVNELRRQTKYQDQEIGKIDRKCYDLFEKMDISTNIVSRINDLERKFTKIPSEIDKVTEEIKSIITLEMNILEKKSVKRTALLQERIDISPTHLTNLKNELLQRIKEHGIDNVGLIDEVRACKSTAFVQEKKLEYLFTNLDRLKKKIEDR